jgi:hypothetical protein
MGARFGVLKHGIKPRGDRPDPLLVAPSGCKPGAHHPNVLSINIRNSRRNFQPVRRWQRVKAQRKLGSTGECPASGHRQQKAGQCRLCKCSGFVPADHTSKQSIKRNDMARKIEFASGLEQEQLAELFERRPPPAFDTIEIPFELPEPHAWPDESMPRKHRKEENTYGHKHGKLQARTKRRGTRTKKTSPK